MGIVYDPMTGEPIETPDEETAVENIAEESKTEDENLIENQSEEASEAATEETSAESENVESIANDDTATTTVEQTVVEERKPIGYDAMTGQPIYDEPAGDDKGFGKKLNTKVLIAIAGVLVALLIIAVGIISGAFLPKRAKVEKAIASTCVVKSELFDVVKKAADIASGNTVEVEYDFDADEVSANGKFIMDGKNKQVVASVNADSIPKFTLRAGIDSKQVLAEIPELSDKLFFYDYTAEKDGMIADYLGSKIDDVDAACKFLYDITDNREELQKKIAACTVKHSKELAFESVEAKNFKINNKKVKCKGYSTTIDEDFCADYLDDLIDIYADEIGEALSSVDDFADVNIKQELKELKKELKGMPDTDIIFYIYRGKLADIHIEAGRNDMDIIFRGGDYRAQNIIIEENGNEVISFKASTKKDKEIYSIYADGDQIDIEYNTKKGKVTVEAGRDEIEFELLSSGNSVSVKFDDVEGVSGTFTLSKSAKIEKYENTDKFDIGNADKYDIQDLAGEFDKNFLNNFGGLF